MSGRENDVEAGPKLPGEGEEEDNVDQSDPFDVADTKNASLETLRRWRVLPHSLIPLIYPPFFYLLMQFLFLQFM